MADNKLKLNDEKTIVLFLSTFSGDHSLTSVVSPSATLSSAALPLRSILIGAIFDQHLSMETTSELSAALLSTIFTTSAGSAMSLISRQLRQLSRPSSSPAWTTVTHICTGCHLHSSTGCSGCRTRQPEWWPERVDGSTSHRCFFRIHWLPVQCHITFKILLLTYRGLMVSPLRTGYWVAGPLPTIPALRSGQQQLLYASPRLGCSPLGIGALPPCSN